MKFMTCRSGIKFANNLFEDVWFTSYWMGS